MIRIAINLDLESGAYASVAASAGLGAQDLETAVAMGPDRSSEPVEIVVFFARRTERKPRDLQAKLAAIGEACDAVAASFPENPVQRILMVDCGDTFMQPLSDIEVLSQYLEAINGRLSTNTEGAVFTADWDADDEDAPIVVRDTRSEAFVDHMTDYTRSALELLSGGAGSYLKEDETRVETLGSRARADAIEDDPADARDESEPRRESGGD